MTASELTELAARVEAGSGECRALDAEIAVALGYDGAFYGSLYNGWAKPPLRIEHGEKLTAAMARRPDCAASLSIWYRIPQWSSSLDATVALIAEQMPDAEYDLDTLDRVARVWPTRRRSYGGESKALSRALLAATLRALAAQQQDRQTEGE